MKQYFKKFFLYFTLILFSAVFVAASNCTSIQNCYDDGRIFAYYSFDSDCYSDDSDNNYVLSGATASLIPGYFGNACLFDGNDRTVNFTLASDLNKSDTLCISLWLNNSDTANGYQHLIYPQITGQEKYWGAIEINNGAGDQAIIANTVNSGQNYFNDVGYSDVAYARTHFVYCSDSLGRATVVYRDNVSLGTDITPQVTAPLINGFYIGGSEKYATNAYAILDEIWVINSEINADVVAELFLGANYPGVNCTEEWVCSEYAGCANNDINECLSYTDNSLCDTEYTGSISDFDLSCSYCSENEDLSICVGYTLEGDEQLIFAMVVLWLGLWVFGYYLFQNNNEGPGIIFICLTIPIDIYFQIFLRNQGVDTKLLAIGFDILAVITLAIIPILKRQVKKKK